MVDKDRPSSWRAYKKDLCCNCKANCCTMPVEIDMDDLLQMGLVNADDLGVSPKKVFKRLQSKGVITSFRVATGKYMLAQKANSDCYFLDSQTRLCTIYEKRPFVCREFPKIGPRSGYCPYQSK